MTQSTTPNNPSPDLAAEAHTAPCLYDILMNFIIAFLTPMFLGAAGGNLDHARMAAIETINAYRTRDQADLIAIAQIIAFGLATLGSLSQSMADDISLSMALRLRTNAASLSRAAEKHRRALAKDPGQEQPPHHAETPAEPATAPANVNLDAAEAAAVAASARSLAAQRTDHAAQSSVAEVMAEKRHQAMWAIAMVKEAEEIITGIPDLPPAERRAASIRAAALGSAANELLTGVNPRHNEATKRAPTSPGHDPDNG